MESPVHPRAGTRRILALLLALAVFAATGDYHPAAGHVFAEAAGSESSSYSHAAVHPGQPLHFEASEIVKRPVCEICLLRLQTAGAHLLESVQAVPLVAQDRVPTAAPPRAGRPALRPCSTRGPPSR